MRYILSIFALIIISCLPSHAQEISAQVLDSQSRQPIPFATVQYAKNNGVITNDEGHFAINAGNSKIDSLEISSLGYFTLKLGLNQMKETILLKPANIELRDVFLTNKNLTGKEIVKKIKEKVNSNYNFDFTHKRFFFRESNVNTIRKFDLLVDKSTIAELNQDFFNRISNSVPKISDSYKEVLGDFYGNYNAQKIQLIKAANLHNPQSTTGLTDLMERLEHILHSNIKKNSKVKIKSGIIGFKMDASEFEKDLKEETKPAEKSREKTNEENEKELLTSQKSIQASAASNVKRLLNAMFWKEGTPLDVFEKSNAYTFNVEGYAQIDNDIVYVISFEPKRGAEFKGKMYVNTQDFGIHRLDYKNIKPLKKFKLFGISTREDVYRGKMIFAKDESGKYNPTYLEQEKGDSFGIDRPLSIIEKNKFVAGRNKQNELDLDIGINSGQVSKYQLVVYENSPITENTFEVTKVSGTFDYEIFKVYTPEFWQGYNIIEPNAAIKAFTAMEEEEFF